MSGAAFQYWAMTENNDHLEIAHKIANDAGKTIKNTKDLVEFLQSQLPETLVKYGTILPLITDRLDLAPFTPVIESKSRTNKWKRNILIDLILNSY